MIGKIYRALCVCIAVCLASAGSIAQQGQITIARVEQMPNAPTPYNVRDWHTIAIGYDTFVYDATRTGQYLPLISIQQSGINYPGNASFGMHSYVGTPDLDAGEAINILPSLVGATLNGVDKQDQNGMNWILMSQDYFNKNNGEYLYLNNRGAHSGSDWWYDLMPNIFFYQLYDLYGDLGDAAFQFTTVADRFLEAVRKMEGSDTPWNMANMDYRAWNFLQMEPNAQGVHEPEAAGAYAWVLYNAYKQTGNKEYLKGAEWSIEFLNSLNSNPSYELQLPYGVYIAAKMRAELHTDYDIEKLISWVFNRGPIRGWGTIVGKWGGLDVSGLVGEANDGGNDYAFQLNGVQQAAALVPAVRYDKRFSRAVAKWFLNLANATRFMYPRSLPAAYQDGSAWSDAYDPQGVIGYEALREQHDGFSPFSTGDALGGGWAGTNLALYSSSSIGYLGALFTKTNQDKILLLDLLKTDFFGDNAYSSFLLFNPFTTSKDVLLQVGDEPIDIYDALSETFLLQNVTGEVSVTVPADEVLSLVYAPAGGSITYEENKMLIDGVIVDYDQHASPYTFSPRIKALAAAQPEVEFGDSTIVYGTAIDPETPELIYRWEVTGGSLHGTGPEVKWVAPPLAGSYEMTLIVQDTEGKSDTAVITLQAVAEVNTAPVIHRLGIEGQYVDPGATVVVNCLADDENGDPLTYAWSADAGSFAGTGSNVLWTSPSISGIYTIHVEVSDNKGAVAEEQLLVLVHEFGPVSGNLIAHYPFDGNAMDVSGNNLHGTVLGPKLTEDRFGNAQSAYNFDGINDHIVVINTQLLNFSKGITVSCLVKPTLLPDKETFIISHGSWQNRWKLSITPDRHVRWTIKNTTGQVRDLDSKTQLVENITYSVAASYDGELILLYLNGSLENITTLSGDINPTTIDMEIGQMLPDVQLYNLGGVLDDIRIYDYALHPDTISQLTTSVTLTPGHNSTITVYPNPTTQDLMLDFGEERFIQGNVRLVIYDQRGQAVRSDTQTSFNGQLKLNTKDLGSGIYYVEMQSRTEKQTVRFIKLE